MKIDIYKTVTYNEDEQKHNPSAYHDNGNRKCQHIYIPKKIATKMLEKFGIPNSTKENVCLSILWNLPRKKYAETLMWVCISGFFYCNGNNADYVCGNNFVISNNNVTEKSQKTAIEVLEYLSTQKVRISYKIHKNNN